MAKIWPNNTACGCNLYRPKAQQPLNQITCCLLQCKAVL